MRRLCQAGPCHPRSQLHPHGHAFRRDARSTFCCELGIQILKIASSDCNDWILIEKIAKTKKPVIVSTGGSSLKDIDDLVTFFDNRHIPLAINHCVSLYPTEDHELELNQIDFLRNRYPNHVIGFSTHEYHDWTSSMLIAYAKGARTFERHVDIETDGMTVSPYCSLPDQVDTWFKAFHHAKSMCGAPGTQKRLPPQRDRLPRRPRARSLRHPRPARRPRAPGRRRLSRHSPAEGPDLLPRTDARRNHPPALSKDQPITIDAIDSPYASIPSLKDAIYARGLATTSHAPSTKTSKAGDH